MIPDILKGPLRFGDPQQIRALREMERKAEYDALPECRTCGGGGKAYGECLDCCGEGKDWNAMEAHRKKYPL